MEFSFNNVTTNVFEALGEVISLRLKLPGKAKKDEKGIKQSAQKKRLDFYEPT